MMDGEASERFFKEPILNHVRRDIVPSRISQTVGQVLAALRAQPPAAAFFYIYVVDEAGRLMGVVPTRDLLVSTSDTAIATLVQSKVVTLPSDATVLDACEFFMQHRYLALPVVEHDRTFLGTVDVGLVSDEVFNLAEQQARDDVFQLIGIHVLRSQRFAPWANFRDRFPWLVANIIGGTLCALITSQFEDLLAAVIAVALFVPIVLTLAESVSIQSMSITLQILRQHVFAPGPCAGRAARVYRGPDAGRSRRGLGRTAGLGLARFGHRGTGCGGKHLAGTGRCELAGARAAGRRAGRAGRSARGGRPHRVGHDRCRDAGFLLPRQPAVLKLNEFSRRGPVYFERA